MELGFDTMLYSNFGNEIVMRAISNVHAGRRFHTPDLYCGNLFSPHLRGLAVIFLQVPALLSQEKINYLSSQLDFLPRAFGIILSNLRALNPNLVLIFDNHLTVLRYENPILKIYVFAKS